MAFPGERVTGPPAGTNAVGEIAAILRHPAAIGPSRPSPTVSAVGLFASHERHRSLHLIGSVSNRSTNSPSNLHHAAVDFG